MRLSEAIRLGAMLTPQAFGRMLRDGATCALGAAANAMHLLMFDGQSFPSDEMYRTWPVLDAVQGGCPLCAHRMFVADVITHLNDEHRWTRERIADWVATIEAAAPTEVVNDTDQSRLLLQLRHSR